MFNNEISEILKKVESAITANDGLFEGNTERDIFHYKSVAGLIKGEYRSSSGNEIEITITDRPFFVPYRMIEVGFKKRFS